MLKEIKKKLSTIRQKYYLAKSVSSTTRGYTPTTAIIWVRPQKITHWAFMWDFLNTIKVSDVIKCFNRWG